MAGSDSDDEAPVASNKKVCIVDAIALTIGIDYNSRVAASLSLQEASPPKKVSNPLHQQGKISNPLHEEQTRACADSPIAAFTISCFPKSRRSSRNHGFNCAVVGRRIGNAVAVGGGHRRARRMT